MPQCTRIIKHSVRDVARHKCHFCLALCSVFIVVLSTLVVNTVIQQGPIIFLSLAQQESGEIDAVYVASLERAYETNGYWNDMYAINYTHAVEVFDELGVEHYTAPRIQMCPINDQSQFLDADGKQLGRNGTMCVQFSDTQMEKDIQVGVGWPYEALGKNECILSSSIEEEYGVQEGDTVQLKFLWSAQWNLMRNAYNEKAEVEGWPQFPYFPTELEARGEYAAKTLFQCKVVHMIGKTYGKMPDTYAKDQIMMEYRYYMDALESQTIFNGLIYSEEQVNSFKHWMLSIPDLSYQYASQVLANMPPPRLTVYQNDDFNEIQKEVLEYLYPITNGLGLYNIGTTVRLLAEMQTYSEAVLFIGLIFDILLLIFIVVACLLIYSLLLIQVETKAFQTGVMRLIGLSKRGYVGIIMTQAFLFVVPSVILGFLVAIPCIALIYSVIFTEDLGFSPKALPNWYATIQALLIGIFIPLLSSIIPVQRALQLSLNESLNTQRAKTTGTLTTFVDNEKKDIIPYIIFGSIAVIFGVSVYYFLPLAIIKLDLGLLLSIFFSILLCMLLGLTLLATNLQGLIEVLFIYLFFFWEKKSMRTLLRKNLGAHKKRNSLTSLIYALTLGCIIFLLVTASLQIQSISSMDRIPGVDIYIFISNGDNAITDAVDAKVTDPILMEFKDSIQDFAYITADVNYYQNTKAYVVSSDLANIQSEGIKLRGLQTAQLIDDTMTYDFYDTDSDLTPSEQLYTARGYQGIGTTSTVADAYIEDLQNYTSTMLIQNANFGKQGVFYQKRVLWTTENLNGYTENRLLAYTNIPLLSQISQLPIEEIEYAWLMIQMKDPDDHETIDRLAAALNLATSHSVDKAYLKDNQTKQVEQIIDYIFLMTIAIMMFLCFFSLSASMSANLYDQTKEIGVMRAMGVTKMRIKLLYFYEALILVFSASILGVLIGVAVGWTMKLQMDLFLMQKSQFYFPWKQTLEIFCLSLVCAFLSTFGPTTELTRRQIAAIFRMA